jgi:hypothetical protein
MKSITEGLRAMLYYCGYAMDRAATAVDPEEQKRWQGFVDLLIPIAKARATERGVELSSLALRIYGGAGYTCEYPIEQYVRDSKAACVFEGTTGIQAIDFVLRKVPMKGGTVFKGFLESMDGVLAQARSMPDWRSYADQLSKTRDTLGALPGILADVDEDSRLRTQLFKATPFLEAAGDTFVAYFLLWSAMVAEEKITAKGGLPADPEILADTLERDPELAFLVGKINNARSYIAGVLPEVDGKLAASAWIDPSARMMADASF